MKKILLFLVAFQLLSSGLTVFAYNREGNTTSGETIDYKYDSNNRLVQIITNAGSFNFEYDKAARRIKLSRPNGTYTTYSYDPGGRLTNLTHRTSNGSIINSFTYSYDKVGNVLTKTDTDIKYTYTYDAIYRLTQAIPAKLTYKDKDKEQESKAEYYGYDAVGNRLRGPETRDFYSYNQLDQLTEDRKHSYEYDKNGNLTRKTEKDDDGKTKTWTYSYDYENRLIKVVKQETNETLTTTFNYDPFGRRIRKTVEEKEDGKTETKIYDYVYDNEDIILEYLTKAEDGKVKTEETRYIHGPSIDEPLAIERNGEIYYYHADGLGSIVALTDKKQKVMESYSYSSFGEIKRKGDKVKNTFTFTAREWDEDVGLYYYRARYYDPKIGRLITKDPSLSLTGDLNIPYLLSDQLLSPQELNPYVYVANNPVSYTDPSGLFVQAIAAICISNPALCASVGAITIGTITQMFKNPPIVPPIPLNPPKPPEQCKDDTKQHCIDRYVQCIMQKWKGPCGDCLNKCTAQGEWDFGMCHP
ncbi:MAG: RHS repeat-associated core domain-containing protein [Deltaproteobacteria bacterium]|nr:RHS repeat-associated core domain-containing protein [Deltaproteobacteria bacterium]